MEKVRLFFSNLLSVDNIIRIVGFIVAAILAYSGIKDNNTSQALTAVITILGALAIAQIIEGSKVRKSIEHIEYLLEEEPSVFFEDRGGFNVSFGPRVENAQHVDMLGLSLAGILTHYGNFILQKTRAGCKFRVLLVDPDSHAVNSAAGFLQENVEHRQEEIWTLARNLEVSIETGNTELRFTSVAPPYSLLITDPEKPNGQVQVELYAYNVYASERPHFVLTQAIDKHWYDFFRGQFEYLWNDARLQNQHLPKSNSSRTNEV